MTTYNKQNPESIRALFSNIAKNYDRGNAILSLQLFRLWNRKLIKKTLLSHHPKKVLDLCCGTGAIGLSYLKKAPRQSLPKELLLVDFCEEMLACAKDKAKALSIPTKIRYLEADAQKLPLPSGAIDAITLAYGIRNIKDPSLCIKEIYRLLKKGGKVGILELTRPKNPLIRLGHSCYLHSFVPLVGKLMASNEEAYQYLCNSIHTFIPPEDIVFQLKKTGFREIKQTSLAGGIATLFTANK